ncbi:MAG: stage III sporulation protein AE [Oscillospiraceae bacterium]
MKRILLCLFLTSVFLCGSCFAAETDIGTKQRESFGVDAVESALPEEAEDMLGEVSVDADLNLSEKLSNLWDATIRTLSEHLHTGLRSVAMILIITALCALAETMGENNAAKTVISLGGVLAVATVVIGNVSSFFQLGTRALTTLSQFSKALLPCMAATAAASGAIGAAAAQGAATALFLDVLLTAMNSLVMPLIYAYTAAVIADAAVGGTALSAAAKLMKKLCTLLLTLLVTAFTVYFSITGVLSGAAGQLSIKLTKTAVSAALPVVGSILSDAASSVLAGAAILKNTVGIFGLLVVLAVCLTPMLTLGCYLLLYKLAAAVTETLSDKRMGSLIGGIGDAFGMVLAAVGAGGFILLFSIITSIRAVSMT